MSEKRPKVSFSFSKDLKRSLSKGERSDSSGRIEDAAHRIIDATISSVPYPKKITFELVSHTGFGDELTRMGTNARSNKVIVPIIQLVNETAILTGRITHELAHIWRHLYDITDSAGRFYDHIVEEGVAETASYAVSRKLDDGDYENARKAQLQLDNPAIVQESLEAIPEVAKRVEDLPWYQRIGDADLEWGEELMVGLVSSSNRVPAYTAGAYITERVTAGGVDPFDIVGLDPPSIIRIASTGANT